MRLVFVSIPTYVRPVPASDAPGRRARRNGETLILQGAGLYVNSVARRSLCRGLWALATACRDAGHEVTWIDAGDGLLESPETMARIALATKNADQLWMYAMTPTEHVCLQIAREAKRRNPKIAVLLGGPHASARYREILTEHPEIDLASTGFESSGALAARCERLSEMPAAATRDEGGSIRIAPSESTGTYVERVAPEILERPIREYHLNVSSSVGCAFSCAFCVDGRLRLRSRALDGLREELLSYDRTLPPGTLVHFFDTVFGLPRAYFDELSDFLATETHRIVFSCDVKANVVTDELAARFARARVRLVSMGVETSQETVLRLTRKSQGFMDCIAAARTLRRHLPNAILKAYWILGLPGTTAERAQQDLAAAEALLREGVFDIVSPKFFVPYPGTPYWDAPARHGLTITSRDLHDYDRFHTPPVCHPDGLGAADLARLLVTYEEALSAHYARRLGVTVASLREDLGDGPRYNGHLYDVGPALSGAGRARPSGPVTVRPPSCAALAERPAT
ncbi:MAG: cobalamin-dependent protein [Polyangiaceae bacterium]